nr:type IV secretion system DNA-binding domain-containing protein [Polaribacter cellanae]
MYHFYIIGRSGSGKSTLLHTKMKNDIIQNNGFCLIDPHSDLVKDVYKSIPPYKEKDVLYLDASSTTTLGYNPLKKVSYEKRALVASSILEILERIWGKQGWGVKLSHLLRNSILCLTDQPSANFADILKLLQDKTYRESCIPNIENPTVKQFFEKEFNTYTKGDLLPVFNKIGGLLSYPSVYRILVTNKEQISLRSIMDNKKILLVNLAKGSIGNEPAQILGGLLLISIANAGFSRVDTPQIKRKPFFVYADEFQEYSGLTLAEMLSQLRKFHVGLILAHQYGSQLELKVRDAILSNVGTIVSFRLGQADAKTMEREFSPVFMASDFVNIANYSIYLKMMISGVPSIAFSANTLEPEDIY